ncbi:acid phosphatase AphA [Rhizodiscina lignyota]|uniref:Purple acid phosphatase n=1 Tax=Rhizodiscina lignyota TaxID=1504668 RepID=A0A9P4IAK7_9PEZI|nr:acid phosphatase AphA [Rhizodiscina lignyota]
MWKPTAAAVLFGGLLSPTVCALPVVDQSYPYMGPAVPIGDWVDTSVSGDGKGFKRLVELPAVKPATNNPSNNINVISMAYIPDGIVIHCQTPFGLNGAPSIQWGTSPRNLNRMAFGYSHTYDRTPPCSMTTVTQCSQFFHEVRLNNLRPDTTYYYQIPASNGTTRSEILNFSTARAAGDAKEYTAVILNDMGYTNAAGTHKYLTKAVDDGVAFAWHGGDLSYADDWFLGFLPCAPEDRWPVCYNGTDSRIPGDFPEDIAEYDTSLPPGEVPNWGSPQGGDMSVIYESNWDLWQQWMSNITTKIPYMVLPGNHEAACAEFDGPGNLLTAYLNNGTSNTTSEEGETNWGSDLSYYSCPPSQRNFTAYQHRFNMAGGVNGGGVGNMWYSFDYGLAHFISLDGETDFANSPEHPFASNIIGNETNPSRKSTHVTDSGPFGKVDGDYNDNKAYAQYQWLAKDLAAVDRRKTPWILVMSHRPMYSTQVSAYQKDIRAAFETLLLEHGVDVYLSGHIHWYERLWPMTVNGSVDTSSIKTDNIYYTNPTVSMTHIINGMAGNSESHVVLSANQSIARITAKLDQRHYGFNKLRVINSTALSFTFIQGSDGSVGDEVTILKRPSSTNQKGNLTFEKVLAEG